jgi:hypothetical protein
MCTRGPGRQVSEQCFHLTDREAVRVGSIDRWHDSRIKDIDIEMHPVASHAVGGEQLRDGCRHRCRPELAYPRSWIDGGNCGAGFRETLVVIAAPDVHGISRAKIWRVTIDRSDCRPVQSDGGREVFASKAEARR